MDEAPPLVDVPSSSKRQRLDPILVTASTAPTLPTPPTATPSLASTSAVLQLPTTIDPEHTLLLQELFQDPHAAFRTLHQYHAFWLTINRLQHFINIAPTGAGKTLAVMLALKYWEKHGIEAHMVMMVPYLVLQHDMIRRFREVNMTVQIWDPLADIHPGANLIIVQLEHTENQVLINWLNSLANGGTLGGIIFDEAHGIAEDTKWRDTYKHLWHAICTIPNMCMQFLTATLSPQHEAQLWKTLHIEVTPSTVHTLRSTTNRLNISYQWVSVNVGEAPYKPDAKWTARFQHGVVRISQDIASKLGQNELAIIFTFTQVETEQIANALQAPYIHGGVTVPDRELALAMWRTGSQHLLVCNKAGYYGLDEGRVVTTLHVGKPRAVTEFSQASGRAGRKGQDSRALIILPTVPSAGRLWNEPLYDFGKAPADQPLDIMGEKPMETMLSSLGSCLRLPLSQFLDGIPVTCADLAAQNPTLRVLQCISCVTVHETGRWASYYKPPPRTNLPPPPKVIAAPPKVIVAPPKAVVAQESVTIQLPIPHPSRLQQRGAPLHIVPGSPPPQPAQPFNPKPKLAVQPPRTAPANTTMIRAPPRPNMLPPTSSAMVVQANTLKAQVVGEWDQIHSAMDLAERIGLYVTAGNSTANCLACWAICKPCNHSFETCPQATNILGLTLSTMAIWRYKIKDVVKPGPCYTCLFPRHDIDFFHEGLDNDTRICCFPNLLMPLTCWLFNKDNERVKFAAWMGNRSLERRGAYIEWLFHHAPQRPEYINACTQVFKWFGEQRDKLSAEIASK